MASTIQILGGESQHIHALHSRPREESIDAIDHLLIIMVHGIPGHCGVHNAVFGELESLLSDKDYHTLRFDFRGCGKSEGREEDFTFETASEDLKTVLKWARGDGYERFIFISEGLGATFCIMNMPEDAVCSVMLWPMLNLPMIADKVFNTNEIEKNWETAGYILHNDSRIGLPFLKQLQEIRMELVLSDLEQPLLLMHGARDEISPIEQLDMVREHSTAVRRMEITSFHDGEHGLPQLNHRKTMFYHIMQFIEKYT